MKKLDMKCLLQANLKRWWIIALCTFICTAAAIVASLYLMNPIYQSNTTLYIIKGDQYADQKSDEYMDLLIGSQIIKDYRELAKSRLVANQVIQDLKLSNISVEELSKKVSVDLKSDTRVIQISATDTDPAMAKILADKVTDVFIEKVVDIMQAMNAKVIDRAELPQEPVKLNKMKYTFAAFCLGLIIGFGIVYLIEFLDNTIKTVEDIKEHVHLPIIGSIPSFSEVKEYSNAIDPKVIISYKDPRSPISEVYRMLRTNIHFFNCKNPLKSFAVTSYTTNEGKTTTAVNLAVIFSQQGSRVLLIDCDLRKPQLQSIFNFENYIGLTSYLSENYDYKNYVKKSYIEHLDVLVCGAIPPNPSELLLSNQMKKLMQKAKEDYDIVLVDTPPLGVVTDAAVVSTIADGTIIVAASGKITIDALVRVKEILNNVNANIIGVVLTKLGKNASGQYYNQYYNYTETNLNKRKNKIRNLTSVTNDSVS